jgi:hypothetical protein
MSIDPSGKGRDETAYSVVFVLNGRLFVKDIGGFSGGYDDESIDGLCSLIKEYKINYLLVEENFGGGSFGTILQNRMVKKNVDCEIVGIRAKGQKELRIINTVEPLLNQHKIIINKALLDNDSRANASNSFTYQLSHLTRERECLKADDRIDSFEMVCAYAVENFLDVDEDRGMEILQEQEMEEIMAKTMEMFSDSPHFKMNRGLSYISRY